MIILNEVKMKKLIGILLAILLCIGCVAAVYTTVYNPWTGKQDYVGSPPNALVQNVTFTGTSCSYYGGTNATNSPASICYDGSKLVIKVT